MYHPSFTRQAVFEDKKKTTVGRDSMKAKHFNFWTRNPYKPQLYNTFNVTSLTLDLTKQNYKKNINSISDLQEKGILFFVSWLHELIQILR